MNVSQQNFARLREWFIRDPRLYDVWERGLWNPTDLERVDQQIFGDLMFEFMFNAQLMYLQHSEGVANRWESLRAYATIIFDTPGRRHLVGHLEHALNSEFIAEISPDSEGAASD